MLLGHSQAQVMEEAARCLYCHDAPCVDACPAGINIPEFIARVRTGNLRSAAQLIYTENPFGWSCGCICPTADLCVGSCLRGDLDRPIEIGVLQAFACEHAITHQLVDFEYPHKPDKARVAVIGGGPAGLSFAHFARLEGYAVTVYEREPSLGGLLLWGIPPHRLDRTMVKREIGLVSRNLNWKHQTVDARAQRRILREYDAVFIAPGKWAFANLCIPGEDCPQVISAQVFLKDFAAGSASAYDLADDEVAIIGGGSTAVDAARVALQMGARRAMVVYRRSLCEMPACSSEYIAAAKEGVEFVWLSNPVSITKRSDGLWIDLEKMILGEPDESGRCRPIPCTRRASLNVDRVLVAVSSLPEPESLSSWPGVGHAQPGPVLSRSTRSTGEGILLMGGDVVGSGTVVQAVDDGKSAAKRLGHWLEGET